MDDKIPGRVLRECRYLERDRPQTGPEDHLHQWGIKPTRLLTI